MKFFMNINEVFILRTLKQKAIEKIVLRRLTYTDTSRTERVLPRNLESSIKRDKWTKRSLDVLFRVQVQFCRVDGKSKNQFIATHFLLCPVESFSRFAAGHKANKLPKMQSHCSLIESIQNVMAL